MDLNLLLNLGLNTTVIIAIIGISEFLKKIDSQNKLKRFYIFFPLLLSVIGAYFITSSPFNWKEFSYNIFIYFGISTLFYNTIKKVIIGSSGENKNFFDILNNNNKSTNDTSNNISGGYPKDKE